MSNEYDFRKIDIDALDEDALRPEDLIEPDPRGPDGTLSDARARSQETRNLVSRCVLPKPWQGRSWNTVDGRARPLRLSAPDTTVSGC